MTTEEMNTERDRIEEAIYELYDALFERRYIRYRPVHLSRVGIFDTGLFESIWEMVDQLDCEPPVYVEEDEMSISTKIMENERMRWGYMNDVALSRRLWKVTREDKLEAFLILAKENDAPDWLVGQAIARAEQLGFYALIDAYKERAFSTRRPKAQWKKKAASEHSNGKKIHERKIRI